MKIQSAIKIVCNRYLGNRGITDPVKRCARFEGLWFIVFEESEDEVWISKDGMCYECWDIYDAQDFKWNKANYKAIKNNLEKI